jgi:uncharacterized membrane protein YdbT with pleckstrin-like domain
MRKPEPCGLFPIVQKEETKTTKNTFLNEVFSFVATCVLSILGVILIPVVVVGWCLIVQYFFNML